MPPSRDHASSQTGDLRFAIDAALLFQLGEELVNKRSVALGELIKNAYDADATKVTLTFLRIKEPGGEIQIADNGSGLTFERLSDTWMRIATSAKVREPFSERFHRPRTGAKGIGRFASRRLAHKLEVVSTVSLNPKARRSGGAERIRVLFDWDLFTPGKQIGEVAATYRREEIYDADLESGVTLRLLDLRDAWTIDDLSDLHRDLLKLISPIPPGGSGERDPGFSLEIRSEDFPEFSGDVGEAFLAHALGVLKGELAVDGTATYQLKFRGRPMLRFKPPRSRFEHLGHASFEVHFFVYKKDFFLGLPINTRQAQERGREEGGVHVYVDRFRVPPYGDPGDDWLKLDEFRGRRLTEVPEELEKIAGKTTRPMLLLPGNNQLFGRVFLSRTTNPNIRQTLNRERLIEDDPAFEELRSFVRLGIDWMTVSYAREFAASRETQTNKRERNDPIALLAKAKEAFSAAAEDMAPEQRAQILQSIELARQTVAEQQEEIISELSMLRVLASTGTMIVVFQHQLLGTLAALRDAHSALSTFVAKLSAKDRQRFEEELVRLDRWVDTTRHQAQLLGLLVARKSRSRRRRIGVRPVVDALTRAFDSYASDYGIHVQNNVPDGLRTPPMFEAELSAVFVNLLTNAFKAVREQPVREISIEGKRVDSTVSLKVQDTGIGLSREDPDEYFKPFVGDSEPDPILGEGTGLGLKIVRDFVDVYGGRARFVPARAPWRTAIEVVLPDA